MLLAQGPQSVSHLSSWSRRDTRSFPRFRRAALNARTSLTVVAGKKEKAEKKDRKTVQSDLAPEDIAAVNLIRMLTEADERRKPKLHPSQRVLVDVNEEALDIVARRAQHDHIYNCTLRSLQIELVKLQEYMKTNGTRTVVLFEGREFAGKAGLISRISEAMSPRVCKVVALGPPSDKDRTRWYFQRFTSVLPAAGEMVLMYRSWYERAGIERVMGYCTDEQYELFMAEVAQFERSLTDCGIMIVKYWLEISPKEQNVRYLDRMRFPWKRFVTKADLVAYKRWGAYTLARDEMLQRTDNEWAPWFVLKSDDRKAARLNCISHLLSLVDYQSASKVPAKAEDEKDSVLELPPRDDDKTYELPPKDAWRFVPPVYDTESLAIKHLKKQHRGSVATSTSGGRNSSMSLED